VLHAFGRRAEEVHFIATSATIAGSGDDAKNTLREFLANIAGVGVERVCVFHAIRPPVPRASGHPFHADSATQSTAIRPGGQSEATLGFYS
jgi:hypothetical protein